MMAPYATTAGDAGILPVWCGCLGSSAWRRGHLALRHLLLGALRAPAGKMPAPPGTAATSGAFSLRFRRWPVLALLLALAAPAAAGAVAETGTEELLGRIDARWQRRDAHGAVPDMVALASVVLAIDPGSYEAQWRQARAYFWVAYTQPNRLLKKALAVRAMDWAERARQARPDRVEGHYFYGIATGEYASTLGLMTAVSDNVVSKIEIAVKRAYEIDPDYLYGAPGTVLGRYYAVLPWPLRDLKRSRRHLEEVVAQHPGALIARYYLAETYRALDEEERARVQLEYVLHNDPAPGTELERPAPKPLAQRAMREWFN